MAPFYFGPSEFGAPSVEAEHIVFGRVMQAKNFEILHLPKTT
jgi:hypothetical protein